MGLRRFSYRKERTERARKADTITGDQEAEPTPTEPTITAGYIARWTDPAGPHPGEHRKIVIHKTHIEPACEDSTGLDNSGFSITLTESFVPGIADRYIVRWRAGDRDDAETYANRADALTAYERLIRDSRTCADDPPVKA